MSDAHEPAGRAPRIAPGWWFVAPALLLIIVFFLGPVIAAVGLSFTDFDLYALADPRAARWVGLRNYVRVLHEPLFWQALRNTLYFAVVGGPLTVAASLGAALLVNARALRWKATARAAVNLGTVAGDHIAGIRASSFPQEAFLEAIVVTLGELGALDVDTQDTWSRARRVWLAQPGRDAQRASLAPSFAQSLRAKGALPGGSAGWTPGATFRLLEASSVQDRGISAMTLSRLTI